ncbi:MAG: transposase [Bacteroidales bacterium]|nr:transposase [Bacteroidales bacterium]
MSHSLTKIWIHSILGVKNKQALINDEVAPLIYKHIEESLLSIDCKPRIINGVEDHIHLLFLLSPKIAVADLEKKIKGETSHWINQQNLIKDKFAWQVGNGAFSVSESNVKSVQSYIKTQKEHHEKMTFEEEYNLFLKKHGILINR